MCSETGLSAPRACAARQLAARGPTGADLARETNPDSVHLSRKVTRMLHFFANSWLNRKLARYIPNPYVRAAAVAGSGMLVTRMMRRRSYR